jgi:hypothetical protein
MAKAEQRRLGAAVVSRAAVVDVSCRLVAVMLVLKRRLPETLQTAVVQSYAYCIVAAELAIACAMQLFALHSTSWVLPWLAYEARPASAPVEMLGLRSWGMKFV